MSDGATPHFKPAKRTFASLCNSLLNVILRAQQHRAIYIRNLIFDISTACGDTVANALTCTSSWAKVTSLMHCFVQ